MLAGLRELVAGSRRADPGGPARIVEEWSSAETGWNYAFVYMLLTSVIVLVVQLVLDAVRFRRRKSARAVRSGDL